MEYYHLRTFVAVAEEEHLTRAAERLNASLPAVSAHIRGLEEELGVVLFSRTPKGMRLTDEGRALLVEARQALPAWTRCCPGPGSCGARSRAWPASVSITRPTGCASPSSWRS